MPAIGFVNERFLQIDGERDARVRILRTWVDGGLGLGNHLYRHLSLSRTPLAQYQDDVLRGEVLTRQVLAEKNLPLVYFRHPFLHAGPTREIKQGFEKFLAERGYKVAPATFDHSDWVFTRVYESARATRRSQAGEAHARDVPGILRGHLRPLRAGVRRAVRPADPADPGHPRQPHQRRPDARRG